MEPSSPWKRPDEVMQLHRLKKRKAILEERMKRPQLDNNDENQGTSNDIKLDFSRLLDGEKRRNPFSKNNDQENKRKKTTHTLPIDESSDKTLFALLKLPSRPSQPSAKHVDTDKLATFSTLLQKYTADHTVKPVPETKYKHLPIDWALKTKVRLMSPKPFPWSQHLKANEEASGITGFVRCLDKSSSTLIDISPQALFHQTCLYWQHPHLPWLQLYPRSAGKVTATSFIATNEDVKQALYKDWAESFRSLFQLLRALHCPYFYLCANTFTCLFRAAGICGVPEPCVLIAPTTRGLRQLLRQEDVEFTMPLRPDCKKKLNNSDSKDGKNSSYDSCYDTMDETKPANYAKKLADPGSGDEEDLDSDNFLSQMGFDAEDIKRINNSQAQVQNSTESSVDSAAESLVFARGANAQAVFNCLLNCKSLVSPAGPLAGVPPTLLAPTAFHGGTLQPLKVRESNIIVDNMKYYSVEIRGPMLPTTLHTLFDVLRSSASAHLSATFAHHQPSLAFSSSAKSIAEEECSNEPTTFNKANLSDCGLSDHILQQFCSNDPAMVKCIDSVKYNAEDHTYTW